jgi:hypothetical protein
LFKWNKSIREEKEKSVAKWRNEPAPIIEEQVELTGMAYAKQEIKNWDLQLYLKRFPILTNYPIVQME